MYNEKICVDQSIRLLKEVNRRLMYRSKSWEGKKSALAGNRTRVARVASEHSTTEPPVLIINLIQSYLGDYPREEKLDLAFRSTAPRSRCASLESTSK